MADAATLRPLLADGRVWRARAGTRVPHLSSGYPALDAALGGGWPLAALTEIQVAHPGSGELCVLLPLLAALSRAGRPGVWVNPPYPPYAPGLLCAGVDPAGMRWVRVATPAQAAWACEQALRSAACGVVLGWLEAPAPGVLRRLHLAAVAGNSIAVVLRRPAAPDSAVPLSLGITRGPQGLEVRILRRRGGQTGQLRLEEMHAVAGHSSALPGAGGPAGTG